MSHTGRTRSSTRAAAMVEASASTSSTPPVLRLHQTTRRGRVCLRASVASGSSPVPLATSTPHAPHTSRRGRTRQRAPTTVNLATSAIAPVEATPAPEETQAIEVIELATPSRATSSAPLVDLTCDAEDEINHGEVFVLLEDIARSRNRPIDLRTRPRLGRRNPANETVVLDEDSDAEVVRSSPQAPEETVSQENQSPASSESVISCPICFDGLAQMKQQNKQVYSTVCGHLFCQPCITTAVRASRQCPTCRKTLSLRHIHPLFL